MGGGWFDWDEGNEGHVLDHGAEPGEVEEALLDPERTRAEARNAGRGAACLHRGYRRRTHLFVLYTRRGEKVRPITVRDANGAQKRRYGRGRR